MTGDYLNNKQAAAYTGFSAKTLYREFLAGRLRMRKMRSLTIWERSELDRWLRELPERKSA